MGICEQHYQAIDADAFAGRGRQAVGQRANVIFVELLGSFVAAALDLFAKALFLFFGIVQLGETVADFAAGYEKFEALGDGGIVGRAFESGEIAVG